MENPAAVVEEVLKELRRTPELRYAHHLHQILVHAEGASLKVTAKLLADAPSTVAKWLRRYHSGGLAGLREGAQTGRPKRLSNVQIEAIARVIGTPPSSSGIPGRRWSGPKLALWIEHQFGIHLSGRHARRLLGELQCAAPRGERN